MMAHSLQPGVLSNYTFLTYNCRSHNWLKSTAKSRSSDDEYPMPQSMASIYGAFKHEKPRRPSQRMGTKQPALAL